MQIRETFEVEATPDAVWAFFEQVERVARCVPGVKEVEVVGPERYKVVASRKVGFISATFEMTTQLAGRQPGAFNARRCYNVHRSPTHGRARKEPQ